MQLNNSQVGHILDSVRELMPDNEKFKVAFYFRDATMRALSDEVRIRIVGNLAFTAEKFGPYLLHVLQYKKIFLEKNEKSIEILNLNNKKTTAEKR